METATKLKLNKNQVNDIIHWDITNWKQALVFWDKNLEEFSGKKCLEIGGKNGGLSLWMALHGNTVLCTDIDNPKRRCLEKHRKHSVDGLITYKSLNLLEFDEVEQYDVIALKSVLGGVARQAKNELYLEDLMSKIHRALKPGGILLFAENLKASKLHQLSRKHLVKWGKSWEYPTTDRLLKSLSEFDSIAYERQGFLGLFGWNKTMRNVFGKLDQLIFNKLIPNKCKYIIFGIARKK